MGSLVSNPAKRASFQLQTYPAGIDLNRSELNRQIGVYKVNVATSFRAGQPLMLNSTGEVVLSDGTSVLGIAKYDKITQKRTVVVDFPVTFGSSGATKNLKPNIISGSVVVRTGTEDAPGTTYALTTDYTLNLSNGTITQVASGSGGSIVPTTVVYVTFARTLTEAELAYDGKNFHQSLDYVTTMNAGRVTVIGPPGQIFTTEFDTAQTYTLSGANSNLYVNSSGLYTSVSSGNKLIGRVISLPSVKDPFIGFEYVGQVAVNT